MKDEPRERPKKRHFPYTLVRRAVRIILILDLYCTRLYLKEDLGDCLLWIELVAQINHNACLNHLS